VDKIGLMRVVANKYHLRRISTKRTGWRIRCKQLSWAHACIDLFCDATIRRSFRLVEIRL